MSKTSFNQAAIGQTSKLLLSVISMNDLSNIPSELDAFLLWLKERSGAAWKNFETSNFEEFEAQEMGGSSWRTGTQWQTGLGKAEIDAIEQKWALKFPQDYRQYLSILNAPDRGMYCVGWSDDPPYGLQVEDDEPSFFDWQKHDEAIADSLAWPLEGLLFDVKENSLWLDSWGPQPSDEAGRRRKVIDLVEAAPKLIPLTGHRYLLAASNEAGQPVLSVYQSDIICYGSNLRNFLLLEFSELLGLDYEEITKLSNANISHEQIAAIPFWGELIISN